MKLDILPGVRKNIPLAPYTTFKIGGPARYFFIAKNVQDILEAVRAAKNSHVPFFVLAGGSNILVSDKGFPGLVIKIQDTRYKIQTRDKKQHTKLYVAAGVSMDTLVRETVKRGLSGFEWAGGLPGSVGGAVRGNAGAFGGEIKDNVVSVTFLDRQGKVQKFTKNQCVFAYRNSVFKQRNWLVLSVSFQMKKGNAKKLQKIARDHIRYRKERHPLEYPNAGSVFKNCDVRLFSKKLQNEFSGVVKVDPFPVVPTAYLISKAKLKGLRVGYAEVSRKHPNYIVNRKNARAKDVVALIEKVKKAIKKKFSVVLEQEVEYVS